MMSQRSVLTAAGLAAVTALALSGCSSATKEATSSATEMASSAASSATSAMSSAIAAPAAGEPVGAGCAAYAAANPTGPGSVAGLAADPVATAAGNSPVLTTLASALSGKLNPNVNLVDTLNNGQFTVFAPTDDAFGKLDAATIDKLKKANASGAKTAVVTARTAGGEVEDIHGKKLTATNAKDMEEFLTKQGAKPNAGVFGVSGGNKGEKIKNQFVDQAAQKPEEVHFYDDLSKNTVDVEQNMAGKIPAELHIYGPGEFAHDEADPNRPDKSFDPSGEAEAGKKPAENSGRRYSLDPILERWSRLAGIKS
jgi:uncharacterized surface protein with fasciclin (FAS1) repeats